MPGTDESDTTGPDPILVVDDEPAVRALFARVLRNAGYATLEAAEGGEVLEIVKRHRVALVLLDSVMPGLGGPAVIRALRDDEASRTLPIILVTARSALDDRVSGLQAGADDYLVKPVALDELVAHVRAQLRGHAAWVSAVEREAGERRAMTAALRGVHLEGSPELAAHSLAVELTPAMAARSLAFLTFARGLVFPLEVEGDLRARYRPGLHLDDAEGRALLQRAGEGPWIQAGEEHGVGPEGTGPRERHDVVYVPLPGSSGPIGLLVADLGSARAEDGEGRLPARRLPLLTELADVVATLLRPLLEAGEQAAAARASFEEIIERQAFVPHYQPIVRLGDGSVIGFEALTRFADGVAPDIRFGEAERLGLGQALEAATLGASLRDARRLPRDAILSLNVSPVLVLAGDGLGRALFRYPRPIVLELTEHARVDDYDALRAAIRALGPSVRLAVDDAGSGYASLRHILALRPAYVKLDMGWIRDIYADTARQSLVAGMGHFAAEIGCELIGEGIEQDAERATLARLGVPLGQGYLFGRPLPAAVP